MTATVFDSDLHDAWILVERTGLGSFTVLEFAALLGVTDKSLWRMVRSGVVARADRYEEMPGKGRCRAYWSCAQAAEALADRRRPEPAPPCGSEYSWRRHKKLGEPVDEACREAHNAQNRAWTRARKARMGA